MFSSEFSLSSSASSIDSKFVSITLFNFGFDFELKLNLFPYFSSDTVSSMLFAFLSSFLRADKDYCSINTSTSTP